MMPKRMSCPFVLKFQKTRFIRSVDDLMRIIYPNPSQFMKLDASARIFRGLRKAKNHTLDNLEHLQGGLIILSDLKRAMRDLIKIGLVDFDGETYRFSVTLPEKLRELADLIEVYMNPKYKDPKRAELIRKAKMSIKALEDLDHK